MLTRLSDHALLHPSHSFAPPQADKLFLYERFGRFGAILSVDLVAHSGAVAGYVTFDTPEAAARAAAATWPGQGLTKPANGGGQQHHGTRGGVQGKQQADPAVKVEVCCEPASMARGPQPDAGAGGQVQSMQCRKQEASGASAEWKSGGRGATTASDIS
jgi:RNA recognition motif. (a.k.a. RRM, RBD, or RNP domain)